MMSKPIEIKNDNDLLQELISASSALNCLVLGDDELTIQELSGMYISALPMGEHAYSHIQNCIKYLIEKESKI